MRDSPDSTREFQDSGGPKLAEGHTQAALSLQIFTAVLMVGPCVFLGIVVCINQGSFGTEPNITAWFAIGVALVLFVLHLLITGKQMWRNPVAQINSDEDWKQHSTDQLAVLMKLLQGRKIVACALLEGAIFFNLIIYLVSGLGGNLAAAVFLILTVAARFLTRSRVESWIESASYEIGAR